MARTILLADESANARRMGRMYLEDLGYDVQEAADGATALAVVENDCPVLVLAASTLPDVTGAELCRRIKARWREVAVLIVVGGMAASDPAQWPEADGVLRKPLSSAGLDSWMKKMLRKSPQEMLLLAVAEAARRT